MHAPLVNRRDGSATQDATARLDEFERLTGERRLLRHEEAEAAMAVFTGAASVWKGSGAGPRPDPPPPAGEGDGGEAGYR